MLIHVCSFMKVWESVPSVREPSEFLIHLLSHPSSPELPCKTPKFSQPEDEPFSLLETSQVVL